MGNPGSADLLIGRVRSVRRSAEDAETQRPALRPDRERMIVGTTVVWIAIPGSALVLGRMAGLGALGGWLGFVLETTFASALLWRRWSRGAWRARYGEIAVEKDEAAPMSIPEPV